METGQSSIIQPSHFSADLPRQIESIMSKQKTVFLLIGVAVIVLGLVFWMGQRKKARLAAEKAAVVQPQAQPPKETDEESPAPQPASIDTGSSQVAPLPPGPPAAEQSARISKKDRLTEGLGVAAGVRNKMTKYYQSHNSWPDSNVDMGLPPPEAYSMNTLQSVTVSGAGKIVLLFVPSRGTEEKVLLQGAANKAGDITWACTSPDIRDIEQLINYCTYSK
jgi:Pilin (bacterial filament)